MSINLARSAEAWWAVTPAGLVRLGLPAATTAGLLAGRAALAAAIEAAQATAAAAPRDAVPAESVDLLSPVTAPARVVAQAVNYRSHATDSGFDPDAVPPAFFRKASHSITGPAGDIIRPDGVGFLDYEVELGLVIGAGLPAGTTVTEADLARYVAALVVANDVSARQIQLIKTQFYESKSYPTFTPVGPWLTLVDASDLARLGSLRLTLSVNGQVRQDRTVADMIVRPAQALTLLSRFQPMAPGDLLLTGTPGGTALKAPAKIAGLLDDEVARILDRIGVSEGFLARSRPGSGLRLLDAGHRVMAEFRRGHQVSEHGFPQANMFHQPDLEELMLARVEAHPLIDLRRGAEVTGLDDDDAPGPLTAAPVRVHARIAAGPADVHRAGRAGLRRRQQHHPGADRDHHGGPGLHRTLARGRHPGRGRP